MLFIVLHWSWKYLMLPGSLFSSNFH
jgi:hypothetical protein